MLGRAYYCHILCILILILERVVNVTTVFYEAEWATKGNFTQRIESDCES